MQRKLNEEFKPEKMTLSEFLDSFDFSVRKHMLTDGEVFYTLKDNQGANLGDIESEVFESISEVLDRLDIYYNDYIDADLTDYYNVNAYDYDNYEDLFNAIKDDEELEYHANLLYYILNPEELIDDAEVVNEDESWNEWIQKHLEDIEDVEYEEEFDESVDFQFLKKMREFDEEDILKALKGIVSKQFIDEFKWSDLNSLTSVERQKLLKKLDKKEVKEEKIKEEVKEELTEGWSTLSDEELRDYAEELTNMFFKNKEYYDIYAYDGEIIADIDGDWKHDHRYFDYMVEKFFNEKGLDVSISQTEAEDEDGMDDFYHAYHYITVEPKGTEKHPLEFALEENSMLNENIYDILGIEEENKEFYKNKEIEKQYKKLRDKYQKETSNGTYHIYLKGDESYWKDFAQGPIDETEDLVVVFERAYDKGHDPRDESLKDCKKERTIKIKDPNKKREIEIKDKSEVGEPGNPIQRGIKGINKLESLSEKLDESEIDFKVFGDLSEYVDSMLFDAPETIATLSYGDDMIVLDVNGNKRVKFNGDIYRYASDYPQELIDLFKSGEAYTSDKVEIIDNNWFDIAYYKDNNFVDDEVFNEDLSDLNRDELKSIMIYYLEWYLDDEVEESLKEDTVKKGNKWINKGNTGETHGEFKTKKQADAQRKAMFANKKKGAKWGESLKERYDGEYSPEAADKVNTNETEYKYFTEKDFLEGKENFKKALDNLTDAFRELNKYIFTPFSGYGNLFFDVNDYICYNYPFDFSLEEGEGYVEEWVDCCKKEIDRKFELHKDEFKDVEKNESLEEPLYRVVKGRNANEYRILKRVNRINTDDTFINDYSKETFKTPEEAEKMLKNVDKLHFHFDESLKEDYKENIKRQIKEIEDALKAGKTSGKYSDLLANYTTVQNARKELKELKAKLKSLKESKLNERMTDTYESDNFIAKCEYKPGKFRNYYYVHLIDKRNNREYAKGSYGWINRTWEGFQYKTALLDACRKYGLSDEKIELLRKENNFQKTLDLFDKLVTDKKVEESINDYSKENIETLDIHVYDIDWETDLEEVELPKECDIEIEHISEEDKDLDRDKLIDEIADELSNQYGWLVNTFNYEINED